MILTLFDVFLQYVTYNGCRESAIILLAYVRINSDAPHQPLLFPLDLVNWLMGVEELRPQYYVLNIILDQGQSTNYWEETTNLDNYTILYRWKNLVLALSKQILELQLFPRPKRYKYF